MIIKRMLGGIGLLALLAVLGCGRSGTATVTGKVTLPDGSPLPGGRIDFRSASGNMVSGQVRADGTYEALLVPQGDNRASIENVQLYGIGQPPPGLAPLPGSASSSGQRYVPINPMYRKPETSGL